MHIKRPAEVPPLLFLSYSPNSTPWDHNCLCLLATHWGATPCPPCLSNLLDSLPFIWSLSRSHPHLLDTKLSTALSSRSLVAQKCALFSIPSIFPEQSHHSMRLWSHACPQSSVCQALTGGRPFHHSRYEPTYVHKFINVYNTFYYNCPLCKDHWLSWIEGKYHIYFFSNCLFISREMIKQLILLYYNLFTVIKIYFERKNHRM